MQNQQCNGSALGNAIATFLSVIVFTYEFINSKSEIFDEKSCKLGEQYDRKINHISTNISDLKTSVGSMEGKFGEIE